MKKMGETISEASSSASKSKNQEDGFYLHIHPLVQLS